MNVKEQAHGLTRKYENDYLSLSNIQLEVLDGLMLGDGALYRYKPGYNPHLCIARKITDKNYLIDNYSYFKNFCNREPFDFSVFDKRTNKTYYSCKFITQHRQEFVSSYERWYPLGEKIVPRDLVLTPLMCAIWFCDDGCVTVNKKCNTIRLKLSTHGFSKEDVEFLIEKLTEITNEYYSICEDDGNFFIYGSDKATKKFIKFIENDIPISMSRKNKWSKIDFNCSSFAQRKNRKSFDRNKTELLILNSLSDIEHKTASQIAKETNLLQPANNRAKTCLSRYLGIYLKEGLIERIGRLHSYTDTFRYRLTPKGLEIKNEAISINI